MANNTQHEDDVVVATARASKAIDKAIGVVALSLLVTVWFVGIWLGTFWR